MASSSFCDKLWALPTFSSRPINTNCRPLHGSCGLADDRGSPLRLAVMGVVIIVACFFKRSFIMCHQAGLEIAVCGSARFSAGDRDGQYSIV